MKVFLASGVRKSIPKLTLAELAFGKSEFLNLVNFDFLDLADFAAVDRFSKFSPFPSPPVLTDISRFFSFLVV